MNLWRLREIVVFGEMVRAYRRRRGMSQEDLAEAAGFSVRGIRNIEAGGVDAPRPATVRLLADALGVTGAERDLFLDAAAGTPPAGGVGVPRQLPASPPLFTGRTGELAVLDQVRDGSTVVIAAIDGMAGVGKPKPGL